MQFVLKMKKKLREGGVQNSEKYFVFFFPYYFAK